MATKPEPPGVAALFEEPESRPGTSTDVATWASRATCPSAIPRRNGWPASSAAGTTLTAAHPPSRRLAVRRLAGRSVLLGLGLEGGDFLGQVDADGAPDDAPAAADAA